MTLIDLNRQQLHASRYASYQNKGWNSSPSSSVLPPHGTGAIWRITGDRDGWGHPRFFGASKWMAPFAPRKWMAPFAPQTASAEAELPPFAPRIGLLGGNPAHTGFVAPRGVPKCKTRPGEDLRSGPRAASAGFLIAAPYRRTPIRKGNGSPQRKRKMKSRMRKRIKSKSKSRNTT